MRLDELPEGTVAVISGEEPLPIEGMEAGLLPGMTVKMIQNRPMQRMVLIESGGTRWIIDQETASEIKVELYDVFAEG